MKTVLACAILSFPPSYAFLRGTGTLTVADCICIISYSGYNVTVLRSVLYSSVS